ncbi:ATP-binding protein [Achromobacter deleyi]|uniref:ATP-binding protein n=1 Tax=Achromobacter deleyi TaxID=1353891 RepID=UPI001491CC7C|nr:ATP-binding protein [Achromobacter deleyi]QVQ26451.1 response regulator [Achromobacter deleyi]UIP22021.1 ATP-binding protein [Achromobacter deleyi]
MLVDDPGAFAPEPQTAPRTASLLLHFLAAALIACIAAGISIYLFWTFNNVVSAYRRQMNAAAYQAQLFFDRRETLLRSISASAVRNIKGVPIGDTPVHLGTTRQVEVLPLEEEPGTFDWALILTRRDLRDIALAEAALVYSSARHARSLRQTAHGQPEPPAMDPKTQRWLAEALAAVDARNQTDGQAPIVWLHAPKDASARQLFLYTPLDLSDPRAGWIGLEVGGVDAAVDLSRATGGSYILFDEKGQAMLHGPGANIAYGAFGPPIGTDSFSLRGNGWLPERLELSKSVGEDGWRLVYYMPIQRVLQENLFALRMAGLLALLLCATVVLLMRDIRRRLVLPAGRQYQALTDTVALNRKLIEVAPVGLCLLRRSDGAVVLSNDMARRWIKGAPGWRELILSSLGDEAGREHELTDGRSAYLTFASTTYCGEAVMLCGISDISALKKVEHSLLQAKRDADAANQAKTVFLTTTSHEIRTPLYGILGTLELFALTPVSGQQAEYLETVLQSSATLLRTINDTLDLSRIEAGHTVLEHAPFSPARLLNDVAASFAARAHARGLRCYAVAAPDTPDAVIGDLTRIRQILDNLVSNAIKFTDSGQIVLRLKLAGLGADSADLSFQVTDTGPGIAPEHQERLFEPYYQVEGDSRAHSPGSGLGLSICRRLSDMMDGKLNAVSEPGLGTSITFGIRLPLASDSSDNPSVLLDNTTVYVSGAIPEIVANLRAWLQRWGAMTLPYPSSGAAPASSPMDRPVVLLQAWPPAHATARWNGPRVIVHPPGLRPRIDNTRQHWFANAYDLASIAHAVQLARGGAALAAPFRPRAAPERLALRILVAEDHPINQLILREQLEHLGCTVALAENGHEALAMPGLMSFDAVLTDLSMPLLNGYEFTRRLRERGYEKPIFGVTANAFPDELRRAMAAGMNTLLIKPLPLPLLRQTLQAVKEARSRR